MGLLSDIAIKQALESGALRIDPPPKPEHFDSDSVDVHLGDKIYTWMKPAGGAEFTIPLWKAKTDPGSFDYLKFANDYLVRVQPDVNGIVIMHPHTYYVADLLQWTKLPL